MAYKKGQSQMNANTGYVGWSMSRRAAEAYRDGEMPRSKWTKKTIVEALKGACDDLDLMYDPSIERLRKDELFDRFLYASSWHHTSKFFNETDFYAISEAEVEDTFRPMTAEEIEQREAALRAEREAREARDAARRRDEHERLERENAYRAEHGFSPNTVAAFAHEHPECCREWVSRKGNRVISYIDYLGYEKVCPVAHMETTRLYGFNATEPGSFDRAISSYQLRSERKTCDADAVSLKGEVSSHAEAEGWYEEYDRATSHGKEHRVGTETRTEGSQRPSLSFAAKEARSASQELSGDDHRPGLATEVDR